MLPKLFAIAALALSVSHVQAATTTTAAAAASSGTSTTATSTFKFKETYPESGSVPTPKAEWMALLTSANITNAPVLTLDGQNGPKQSGSQDSYCDWTFTLCTRPEDITVCPKGQWGLTYDDGPTEFSPKLYDYLDTVNQKATLFMIGGQVVRFPDLAQRAFKSGHELALHTWSHSYLTTQTNEQIVAELKWTEQAIKEVTGYSPRFFRPPYGDIDDRVRSIAKALGFTPVIWNRDTDDWMLGESTTFQAQWIDNNVTEWISEFTAPNATDGVVTLEHDLYQGTVDAAIRILPKLQQSFKVTTIGGCTGQASYKEANAPAGVSSSAPAGSASPSKSTTKPTGSSNDAVHVKAGNMAAAILGAGLAAYLLV